MIVPIIFSGSIASLQLILVGALLTSAAANYISHKGLMNGLAFPSEIDAVVGEQIYLQIIEPVTQQTGCHYRMTGGKDVDVKTPHKPNIEAHKKEACGLQITNITTEEHGFWRLTSSNDSKDVARGIVFVNVRDDTAKNPIQKNIKSLNVDIAPEKTTYCYVLRPDQTKTAFPQHETCNFPNLDSDAEGNGVWNVVSGVKGKTHEISFQVNVQTSVELLQTFVEHNATLNMKCMLVNSKKTQRFCRFLRLNDEVGFNLEEGRGDERYSYYGNGFKSLECGISVMNPEEIDKSPWKCFIGIIDESGELKTVGAIVDGTDPTQIQSQGDIEATDVYGLENTAVNILCQRNVQTDYCWFRDPSGQKISLSDQQAPLSSDKYRYFGTGITLGDCGLTILQATPNHSGTWSCHMGAIHQAKTDAVQEISVRITETPLVATNLIQDAQHDTSLLLECRSIPEHVPLDYCRFVLPDGTGFSVNEKTTANNPHMDNYYFNPNRQMKSGYCSIVVKKIDRVKHQGQWTCAARLTGTDHESSDEFRVNVFTSNESSKVSTAEMAGMTVAVIFLIGAMSFITYKRYRNIQNRQMTRRTTRQTVVSYVHGTDRISLSSQHSDDSQQSSSSPSQNIEMSVLNS